MDRLGSHFRSLCWRGGGHSLHGAAASGEGIGENSVSAGDGEIEKAVRAGFACANSVPIFAAFPDMAYQYSFRIAVEHRGLHKFRMIRGSDRRLVEAQAAAQRQAWDELYQKKIDTDLRQRERQSKQQAIENNQRDAEERTLAAQEEIQAFRSILRSVIDRDNRIDWDRLKSLKPFPKPCPAPKPYVEFPVAPDSNGPKYQPHLNILDKLIDSSAAKKKQAAASLFESDYSGWQSSVAQIESTNQTIYNENVRMLDAWTAERDQYESTRAAQNQAVDQQRASYVNGVPEAVVEYCDMVLSNSVYPDQFPQESEIEYWAEEKTLVLNLRLPSLDQMPRLKEVRFVRTKSQFTEVYLSERETERLYEDALYQTCLRTVHEVFQADVAGAVERVGFNGRVRAVSKSTGNMATIYVMTLLVNRSDFSKANLGNVEPKSCFQGFGGRAAVKFSSLKPVTPIIRAEAQDVSISNLASPSPNAFTRLVSSLRQPDDAVFLSIGALAANLGIPGKGEFTASVSRKLVEAVGGFGFGIEPDVRYGAPPYQSDDDVVLFRPLRSPVRGEVYSGAAALLQLSMIVAAADGRIDDVETDFIRRSIVEKIEPTGEERQRLKMLERLLTKSPAVAKRALTRLASKIPVEQRVPVAHFLVSVGGADEILTGAEQDAIEKIFQALGLPNGTLDKIVAPLRIDFHETTIQQAVPAPPGESLVPPKSETKSFKIDMTKVASISAETSEVIEILGKVLTDEDGIPSDAAMPSENSDATAAEKKDQNIPAWVDGISPEYRGVLMKLTTQTSWPKSEFGRVASQFQLMPLAVFDAINEWSDEKFGDFLLEGDDPISVQTKLIEAEATI